MFNLFKIIFKSFICTKWLYSYPLVIRSDYFLRFVISQPRPACFSNTVSAFVNRVFAVHTFIRLSFISDWICALPIKWTTVGPGTTWQRHVCHNVLLLAFSSGTAFGRHHFLSGLVVSSFFFPCTHTLELNFSRCILCNCSCPEDLLHAQETI